MNNCLLQTQTHIVPIVRHSFDLKYIFSATDEGWASLHSESASSVVYFLLTDSINFVLNHRELIQIINKVYTQFWPGKPNGFVLRAKFRSITCLINCKNWLLCYHFFEFLLKSLSFHIFKFILYNQFWILTSWKCWNPAAK